MKSTAFAILAILVTGILQAQAVKKPKQFCRGKNGLKYPVNDGYKEGCTQFICVKKGKKLQMTSKPIPNCGPEKKVNVTALQMNVDSLTATVDSLLSLVTKQGTCMSDLSSSDCPVPTPGKISLVDQISSFKDDIKVNQAGINNNKDTYSSIQDTTTNIETCLSDVNSVKCPSSKDGKTSVSNAIMKNKDDVQFHHPDIVEPGEPNANVTALELNVESLIDSSQSLEATMKSVLSLQATKQSVESLEAMMTTLQNTSDKQGDSVQSLEAMMTTLQNTSNKQGDSVQSLEATMESVLSLQATKQSVESLEAMMTTLQNTSNKQGDSIQRLEATITTLQSMITTLVNKQVINGGWSGWGSFTPCSSSCGPSTKTRTRNCTDPEPANGGHWCSGPSEETIECNMTSCGSSTETTPTTMTTTTTTKAQTVLWIASSTKTLKTLKLPDFTPLNTNCDVPSPNMVQSQSDIQEIQGKLYSCDHRLCQTYSAEDNTWKTIPGKRFKSERAYPAGTVIGDKWIVQGGSADVNGKWINVATAEVWSPGTGNWVEAPQYKSPLPVHAHCVVNINGKIMQIGGFSRALGDGTGKCFVDGAEVASLDAPRRYHSCAVFHGEVWVAGGYRTDKDKDARVVEIYNPQSKSWAEGAKLPGEIKQDDKPLLLTYEGNLYYVGGHAISKIYKLNLNQFKWEEVVDIAKGHYKWGHIVNTKIC